MEEEVAEVVVEEEGEFNFPGGVCGVDCRKRIQQWRIHILIYFPIITDMATTGVVGEEETPAGIKPSLCAVPAASQALFIYFPFASKFLYHQPQLLIEFVVSSLIAVLDDPPSCLFPLGLLFR